MNKKQAFKDTLKATAIVAWAFISIGMFLSGADTEPTMTDGRVDPFSLTFIAGLLSGTFCYLYAKKWLDEDKEKNGD